MMQTDEIEIFWSNPHLRFEDAFDNCKGVVSEYFNSYSVLKSDQSLYELTRELCIRLCLITQKLYNKELEIMRPNIKNYGFAEGSNALKALTNKGEELNSIIEQIEKTKEEELVYLNQASYSSSLIAEISFERMSSVQGGKSGACYIATMAYGNYDHPQVIELRNFRDNILSSTKFGRWTIQKYYEYSPKLVNKLQDHKTVNIIIRKTLDIVIKVVKRK